MSNRDLFSRGQAESIQLLEVIERTKGLAEAKSVARSSIAEYIRAAERTRYNYGSFCGAVDWLAAAEGLIHLQEA